MARITLILILVSISTLAMASDWKYFGIDVAGDTWYLDAESVIAEGDTRTYWLYWKLKEPKAFGDNIYYASKAQQTINCEKRTIRFLFGQLLDSKNIPVDYLDLRPYARDGPIIPDSVIDRMREYVCSIK